MLKAKLPGNQKWYRLKLATSYVHTVCRKVLNKLDISLEESLMNRESLSLPTCSKTRQLSELLLGRVLIRFIKAAKREGERISPLARILERDMYLITGQLN